MKGAREYIVMEYGHSGLPYCVGYMEGDTFKSWMCFDSKGVADIFALGMNAGWCNASEFIQNHESSVDRWKHRDKTMLCQTCMYYMNGRCRRHAPDCQKGWPAVFAGDWCGDHKLSKEAVAEIEAQPAPR